MSPFISFKYIINTYMYICVSIVFYFSSFFVLLLYFFCSFIAAVSDAFLFCPFSLLISVFSLSFFRSLLACSFGRSYLLPTFLLIHLSVCLSVRLSLN